jgi:hypothetical protein
MSDEKQTIDVGSETKRDLPLGEMKLGEEDPESTMFKSHIVSEI